MGGDGGGRTIQTEVFKLCVVVKKSKRTICRFFFFNHQQFSTASHAEYSDHNKVSTVHTYTKREREREREREKYIIA